MDDTFMDVFLALHNFLKDAGKLMAPRFHTMFDSFTTRIECVKVEIA